VATGGRAIGRLAASLAFLCALGGASVAGAANSIEVTQAAALGGTQWGVEFIADGSPNPAFLLSRHPRREFSYSFEFLFHPNTLTTNAQPWVVSSAWRSVASEPILELEVRQRGRRGAFEVRLFVYEDSSARRRVGQVIVKRRKKASRIGVRWLAASAPGANDGVALLLRDGIVRRQLMDIDSDLQRVNNFKIGYLEGAADAEIYGSFYFDEFASYR